MKKWILLLLALPVVASAEDKFTVDAIGATYLWGLDDCHKPKDTTRWYIKAIGEKCDSTYKKIYAPTPENPLFFQQVYERTITCKTDTIWAEKVQVWLRPEQLEKLTEILK